jgi:hypothetical protein
MQDSPRLEVPALSIRGQLSKQSAGTLVIEIASQAFFNDGGSITIEAGDAEFSGC